MSRNRVVLGFDTKDCWLVVAWRLIPSMLGLGNGRIGACGAPSAGETLATELPKPRAKKRRGRPFGRPLSFADGAVEVPLVDSVELVCRGEVHRLYDVGDGNVVLLCLATTMTFF